MWNAYRPCIRPCSGNCEICHFSDEGVMFWVSCETQIHCKAPSSSVSFIFGLYVHLNRKPICGWSLWILVYLHLVLMFFFQLCATRPASLTESALAPTYVDVRVATPEATAAPVCLSFLIDLLMFNRCRVLLREDVL